MAQVIVSYVGVATGGATFYYYKSPDNTSPATRIYNGNGVQLPADYYSRVTNNMFPIIGPGKGWMYSYNITDITPVYTTVTDKCTPPSSVTLNTSTKVLTVNGGAGGDLNTLVGWGVSWRDQQIGASTWGAWSGDTLITGRTLNVTAPAGYTRQFRARTRGSAGASYFSDYVVCATALTGNTAPSAPTVTRPSSGAVTHSTTPVVILSCPADPERDAMTLKRQVDSGSWQTVGSVPGAGGTVRDKAPALAAGAHTLRYTLTDVHGLVSGTTSVSLTVTPVTWGRSISAGSVIANQSISHRADIQELRAAVNVLRAYYGLGGMTLPGTVGNFSSWKEQMAALQTAIGEALAVAGVTVPTWQIVPGWPSAAVINQIRAAVILA